LWISSNNLCTLPPLPKSLVILDISCNYKLELPIDLPPNIKFFDCVDDSLCINNYRIVL
jgi:Leucine-rich repeat (LRR) protein